MDGGIILHASCVSINSRAVLITGKSGTGKSSLALGLMALGGVLVADDRTQIWRKGETLQADAPDTIRGQIEARGIGILAADTAGPTPVVLVVDLDQPEAKRLPPERRRDVLGVQLPLIFGSTAVHFPAAIVQYLKKGRMA